MNQLDNKEVEDVLSAINDSREIREYGPYRILIGNENLEYRPVIIADPVPTGKQLLQAAGATPADEFLLYQLLTNGLLESINPDETVDIRHAGIERFLAFKSDRSFRFFINDQAQDWGAQYINGRTLKKLAGVGVNTHDMYLVKIGQDDELIDNRDLFDFGVFQASCHH